MIYGFFYENSIYDAAPLYKFIQDFFSGSQLKRHLNIGIADVLTGQFKSFNETYSSEDMVKVLQASVSFPGVFKTVEASLDDHDSVWFTGSSIYEIDIITPIIHCEKMGYLPEDIVIDVVLSGNPSMDPVNANIYNAFAVAQRTFGIMQYYEKMYGLLRAKGGHPDVYYRHVIGPLSPMPTKIIPVTYTK